MCTAEGTDVVSLMQQWSNIRKSCFSSSTYMLYICRFPASHSVSLALVHYSKDFHAFWSSNGFENSLFWKLPRDFCSGHLQIHVVLFHINVLLLCSNYELWCSPLLLFIVLLSIPLFFSNRFCSLFRKKLVILKNEYFRRTSNLHSGDRSRYNSPLLEPLIRWNSFVDRYLCHSACFHSLFDLFVPLDIIDETPICMIFFCFPHEMLQKITSPPHVVTQFFLDSSTKII